MKVVIHDTDTADQCAPNGLPWIGFWKSIKNLECPSICPCCNQRVAEDAWVGAHVIKLADYCLSDKQQFITPTCRTCNDTYKNSHNIDHPFVVEDEMLLCL